MQPSQSHSIEIYLPNSIAGLGSTRETGESKFPSLQRWHGFEPTQKFAIVVNARKLCCGLNHSAKRSLMNMNEYEYENMWDCPLCKEKREAIRSTTLASLPTVLIIHIKRFTNIFLSNFSKTLLRSHAPHPYPFLNA